MAPYNPAYIHEILKRSKATLFKFVSFTFLLLPNFSKLFLPLFIQFPYSGPLCHKE